jgi:hypothetical protein
MAAHTCPNCGETNKLWGYSYTAQIDACVTLDDSGEIEEVVTYEEQSSDAARIYCLECGAELK